MSKLKFHVYDPSCPGVIGTCETLDEAVALANEAITENWQPDFGDEWSLDVDGVAVYLAPEDCEEPDEDGKLVARAREVDIVHRPADTDENGFSASEQDYWPYGSVDYVCNYRVVPETAGGQALSEHSDV